MIEELDTAFSTTQKLSSRISIIGIIVSIILICIPAISLLGKLLFWSILITNFLIYFVDQDWKWSVNLSNIAIISSLLIWMAIRAQNFLGLKYFIFMLILMCVHISNIPYNRPLKRGLFLLFSVITGLSVFVSITGETFTNPNMLALITTIICLLTFIYFPKKHVLIALISVPVIYLYGARSIFLAIGVSLCILFLVLKLHFKLKNVLLFLVAIIGLGAFMLWDYLMSAEFNQLVIDITNKQFQSGRNLIWGAVFDYMSGTDWIVGVGGGVDHGSIVPEHFKNMSLHSSYVFMLFHYGFIGLSLLCCLFYKVLKNLVYGGHLYSAMLFLVFILRDFFEITLVNNQMAVAILFWGWIANGWIENRSGNHYSIMLEKESYE